MSPETLSQRDKHNATISYCFLAIFMLISRQERYQNPFLRAHARYATLLHVGFLFLLGFLLYTRSLGSFILFDAMNFEASLTNIVLFLLFFILLGMTILGISRALRGLPPRFRVDNPLQNVAMDTIEKTNVTEESEKFPLILSHIPFIGIYLAEKYGHSLVYGARWGTWATLVAVLLLWIDPSLFLLVIWIILCTLWIVYQSVTVFSDNTLHLMGEKLPTLKDVQIRMKSVYHYVSGLTNHDNTLPRWSDIVEYEKNYYVFAHDEIISPILAIPVINIFGIIKTWRKSVTHSSLQGVFLTLLCIVGIWQASTAILILIALASITGYTQIHNHKYLNIPILTECASLMLKFSAWKKRKSETHTTQFTHQ